MASEYIQPLPAKPNLAQQQKLAKDLLRAVWAQQTEALERFNALHPKPPAPDDAKLADAQLVIARGYGFPSWVKLKDKIDSLTQSPVERFVAAVKARDVDRLRELLASHSAVRDAVNQPLFDFGRRAVHCTGDNLALLDLLIAHGADINDRRRARGRRPAPSTAGKPDTRRTTCEPWNSCSTPVRHTSQVGCRPATTESTSCSAGVCSPLSVARL